MSTFRPVIDMGIHVLTFILIVRRPNYFNIISFCNSFDRRLGSSGSIVTICLMLLPASEATSRVASVEMAGKKVCGLSFVACRVQ